MRSFFLVVFAILAYSSLYSQEGWVHEPLDSVAFFGKNLKVPECCLAYKKDHVVCGTEFDMSWLRIPEGFTVNAAASRSGDFIKMMGGKFSGKPIKCYLLGNNAKGRVAAFQPNVKGFQFLFSVIGKVGKDPVEVLLYLNKLPETDEDLPFFVRQILKLQL